MAATDLDGMLKEGRALAKIAKNVTVKVPLTWDGLKACRALTGEGTMVNVTLCFSANQALLAAKAGATFISPFVGRLDDIGADGMDLIARDPHHLRQLSGPARPRSWPPRSATCMHVKQAAMIGADVATVPPAVLRALVNHPLTDKGLEHVPRRLEEDRPAHRLSPGRRVDQDGLGCAFLCATSAAMRSSRQRLLPAIARGDGAAAPAVHRAADVVLAPHVRRHRPEESSAASRRSARSSRGCRPAH